jgi:hypothetical protein
MKYRGPYTNEWADEWGGVGDIRSITDSTGKDVDHEWIADRLNRADELEYDIEQMQLGYDSMRKHLLDMEAEVERLRKFVESLLHRSWGYVYADCSDIQDEAEKLGLIVKVPPDEEFKKEYGDDCEYMYVVAWSPLTDKEAEK